MQVRWTEPALNDLAAIQAYIAKDSACYAQQFIERILDVAKYLELFPELVRKVPEAAESSQVRELIFQNYRISMYPTWSMFILLRSFMGVVTCLPIIIIFNIL
jgi:toxin ParE1/3/4